MTGHVGTTNAQARHRAPVRRRRLRPAVMASVGVLAVGALTIGPTSARFADTARLQVATTTYTVPPATQGHTQASGTGYLIQTRLQVACDDQSTPQWRFRDHVVGTEWHGWLAWSTTTSEPGWTGWVTSALGTVGLSVETQWEVRCSSGTWIGTSQTSIPTQITRTT